MAVEVAEEGNSQPNRRKVIACFFTFGLLSLMTELIIHTAAQDILTGSHVSSSTVVLVIALPVLSVKVASPWFVQRCSYLTRTATVVVLNIGGSLIIVLSSDFPGRLVGAAVASAACSLCEITFLALTSFYDDIAASAVAAGIGMSSLLGPFLYTAMTTWACIAPRMAFGILTPLVMLLFAAFAILPKDHLPVKQFKTETKHRGVEYQPLDSSDEKEPCKSISTKLSWGEMCSVANEIYPLITYLFLLYYVEYLANNSVITTLAFSGSPFSPRDHYLYYILMYHFGKFLGRSHLLFASCICPRMVPYIRVQKTWILTLIEWSHFLFFLMVAWFRFASSVWIVLIFCFTDGFTAGSIYVNSVHTVSERFPDVHCREFALSLLMVGNDVGKLSAGLMGLHVEPELMSHCINRLGNSVYCLTRHTRAGGWYSACLPDMLTDTKL